jgi:hypothetical protein
VEVKVIDGVEVVVKVVVKGGFGVNVGVGCAA